MIKLTITNICKVLFNNDEYVWFVSDFVEGRGKVGLRPSRDLVRGRSRGVRADLGHERNHVQTDCLHERQRIGRGETKLFLY